MKLPIEFLILIKHGPQHIKHRVTIDVLDIAMITEVVPEMVEAYTNGVGVVVTVGFGALQVLEKYSDVMDRIQEIRQAYL